VVAILALKQPALHSNNPAAAAAPASSSEWIGTSPRSPPGGQERGRRRITRPLRGGGDDGVMPCHGQKAGQWFLGRVEAQPTSAPSPQFCSRRGALANACSRSRSSMIIHALTTTLRIVRQSIVILAALAIRRSPRGIATDSAIFRVFSRGAGLRQKTGRPPLLRESHSLRI
jgi:hypothetical protein